MSTTEGAGTAGGDDEAAVVREARAKAPAGPRMGMGMPAEKPADLAAALRRLAADLRSQRLVVLAIIGLGAGSVLLAVIGPWLLGRATNIVFAGYLSRGIDPGQTSAEAVQGLRAEGQHRLADILAGMDVVPGAGMDSAALAIVLAWVASVYLGAFALGWLQGRLTTRLVQSAMFDLRERVEAKLHRTPLANLDVQPRGEVLSRVTNDVDNVAQSMQQTLSQLVTAVFTVLGVLVMMMVISPLLALIALVTVPVSALVTALIARRSQPQFIRQWRVTGELNAHVEENYTGHTLVRVFGQAERARRRFDEANAELHHASVRAQAISGSIQPAMGFLSNIGYVLIAVVGALRVTTGAMTLGEVQAFVQYSRQFSQPITQIAAMVALLQSGAASAERVYELLDAPDQAPEAHPALALGQVRGRVVFEDVSFRYRPDVPLIEGLSLVAEPGQTVAIVGPTGAGKTTLVNLIMRFYELDSGAITLDGVDISRLARSELRRSIGMVLQDTWLFDDSIERNIAYPLLADPSQPIDARLREHVARAAAATHVDAFVRTLPGGYDTLLTEDGDSVSAGERQLLTIARAFVADPPILILDEATSSVDTRTEVLVQRAMGALRAGRTSFVIAHRLSTITGADSIVVMESGRIVEQGSHGELLARRGAYHRLYSSQFAAGEESEGEQGGD